MTPGLGLQSPEPRTKSYTKINGICPYFSFKAFREFGFRSKTKFEEGLKKTIKWYKGKV